MKLSYLSLKIAKPKITENFTTRKLLPAECRLRDLTYSGEILADFKIEFQTENTSNKKFFKILKDVKIGDFPIMVGSKFCNLS